MLDLQTTRLRRLAEIVSAQAQERVEAERVREGVVDSDRDTKTPIPTELEPVHE